MNNIKYKSGSGCLSHFQKGDIHTQYLAYFMHEAATKPSQMLWELDMLTAHTKNQKEAGTPDDIKVINAYFRNHF